MDQTSEIAKLQQQIEQTHLPQDLQEKIKILLFTISRMQGSSVYFQEYDRTIAYIKTVLSLPWGKVTPDILDLEHVKQVLDKNHYGLEDVKNRILEFVSVLILKSREEKSSVITHTPVLSLVGLVGSGKTSIAYSIAEALGRKIARIPLGGLGSVSMLRGVSRVTPDSEPGMIVKSLITTQVMNPVILLDEIDRVSQVSIAEVMGVLLELLDTSQNQAFMDHYIDYPIDLSQVFFITTSNNTKDIANAVLDRLEILQMPSYTDQEKIEIGKHFMLPKSIAEAHLPHDSLLIDDAVWMSIVRPLGYDPGIRTLKRTIDSIVRKIARAIIEGKATQLPVVISEQNIKEFVAQW